MPLKYGRKYRDSKPEERDEGHPGASVGISKENRKAHKEAIYKRLLLLKKSALALDDRELGHRDLELSGRVTGKEAEYYKENKFTVNAQKVDAEMAKLYAQYNPKLVDRMRAKVLDEHNKDVKNPISREEWDKRFRPSEQVRHLLRGVNEAAPSVKYAFNNSLNPPAEGEARQGGRWGIQQRSNYKPGKYNKVPASYEAQDDKFTTTFRPVAGEELDKKLDERYPLLPRKKGDKDKTQRLPDGSPAPQDYLDKRDKYHLALEKGSETVHQPRSEISGYVPEQRKAGYQQADINTKEGHAQRENFKKAMLHFKKITDYPDAVDVDFPKIQKFGKGYGGDDRDPEGQRQYEAAKAAKAQGESPLGIFTTPETPGDKLRKHDVPPGVAVKTYRTPAERARVAANMKKEQEKRERAIDEKKAQAPAPYIPPPEHYGNGPASKTEYPAEERYVPKPKEKNPNIPPPPPSSVGQGPVHLDPNHDINEARRRLRPVPEIERNDRSEAVLPRYPKKMDPGDYGPSRNELDAEKIRLDAETHRGFSPADLDAARAKLRKNALPKPPSVNPSDLVWTGEKWEVSNPNGPSRKTPRGVPKPPIPDTYKDIGTPVKPAAKFPAPPPPTSKAYPHLQDAGGVITPDEQKAISGPNYSAPPQYPNAPDATKGYVYKHPAGWKPREFPTGPEVELVPDPQTGKLSAMDEASLIEQNIRGLHRPFHITDKGQPTKEEWKNNQKALRDKFQREDAISRHDTTQRNLRYQYEEAEAGRADRDLQSAGRSRAIREFQGQPAPAPGNSIRDRAKALEAKMRGEPAPAPAPAPAPSGGGDDDNFLDSIPVEGTGQGQAINSVGRYGGKKGLRKFQGGAYSPKGASGWDDDEEGPYQRSSGQQQQGGILGRLAGYGNQAMNIGNSIGDTLGNIGGGLSRIANPASQIVDTVGAGWNVIKDMFGIQAARDKEIREEEEQRYQNRLAAAEKLRQQQREESQEEREQRINQEKADQEDMIKKVIQDQYRATEASQYGEKNAYGTVHWEGSTEDGTRRLVSEMDDLQKLKKQQATSMTEALGKENAVGQIAKDVSDSVMSRFESDNAERFKQEKENLTKDLLSRGLTVSTPAWAKAMRALSTAQSKEREDARNNSIEQGYKYGQQTFDQKMQIYDKMNDFVDPLGMYKDTSAIGTQHIEKAVLPSAEWAAQRADADANNTNEANRYALDVQKARQEADARQREMVSTHELQDEKAAYDTQADIRRYKHEDESDIRKYAHEDEEAGAKYYHDAGMQGAKFEHEDDVNEAERKWKSEETQKEQEWKSRENLGEQQWKSKETKKERRDRLEREELQREHIEREGRNRRQNERFLQNQKIEAANEDRDIKFKEGERVRLNEEATRKQNAMEEFARKDKQANRLLKKNQKYKIEFQQILNEEEKAMADLNERHAKDRFSKEHEYEMKVLKAQFNERKSLTRDMIDNTAKVVSMGMEAASAFNQYRATGNTRDYNYALLSQQRYLNYASDANRKDAGFLDSIFGNQSNERMYTLREFEEMERIKNQNKEGK